MLFFKCNFLTFLFIINKIDINLSSLFFIIFIITLLYQLKIFKKNKPESCLSAFKFNNISGLVLFYQLILLAIWNLVN